MKTPDAESHQLDTPNALWMSIFSTDQRTPNSKLPIKKMASKIEPISSYCHPF